MGSKQELASALNNRHGHAVLVNALGDYIGDLEAKCDGHVEDAEKAYFQRSIRLAEALCDTFYR